MICLNKVKFICSTQLRKFIKVNNKNANNNNKLKKVKAVKIFN